MNPFFTQLKRAAAVVRGGSAVLVIAVLAMASVQAQEPSPVTVTPEVLTESATRTLALHFQVPEHHHLYADELSVEIAGKSVELKIPEPVQVKDKFSGAMKSMFLKDFSASVPLTIAIGGDTPFAVNLHGCSEEECYFPETRQWIIHPDLSIVSALPSEPVVALKDDAPLTAGFQVGDRASGYLGKSEFLAFLDRSAGGAGAASSGTTAFSGMGVLATIGLILLGGLALNLTPCILPMIPINLAIIGAGANGGNRRRGFALGSAYGFGMALAYGGLGLLVVLTGSKFGTLNSSSWFNFGIAIVFSVLGLAMFDRIVIDFSRFQQVGGAKKTGNAAFIGAAMMGSVSAMLAGACVAPVVISVLLLATTSYHSGNLAGLLFPFVLGLGMALPWPFAGGGLSFLPKPGVWMTRVKYAFGVIIFGFAAWYGWLGISLSGIGQQQMVAARDSNQNLRELRTALAESQRTGQPVLVDFWASWCKNCSAMEHTTLRDPAVKERMNEFLLVRFQADRLDEATVKPVLDEFGVMGLPTYVVLRPEAVTTALPAPKTLAKK